MPRCCVIGAGPSGITAAKHLLQVGLRDVVVYDRERARWAATGSSTPGRRHSSVFETTHIISSKALSAVLGLPLAAGLRRLPGPPRAARPTSRVTRAASASCDHIRFGTEVARVEPDGGAGASPSATGTSRALRLRARGQRPPLGPPDAGSIPGAFSGELSTPTPSRAPLPTGAAGARGRRRQLRLRHRGRDLARLRASPAISMRRGYYFVPKFLFGIPSDVLHSRISFPSAAPPGPDPRVAAPRLTRELRALRPARTRPPVPLLHPVVNSELLYFIRHGRIHPRPDVARL